MLDVWIRFELNHVGFALEAALSIVARSFACPSKPNASALAIADDKKLNGISGRRLSASPQA